MNDGKTPFAPVNTKRQSCYSTYTFTNQDKLCGEMSVLIPVASASAVFDWVVCWGGSDCGAGCAAAGSGVGAVAPGSAGSWRASGADSEACGSVGGVRSAREV